MTTSFLRATLAAAVALAAFGAARGAVAAEPNTLRYGLEDAENFSRLPQVVAERKGFFAREGLNVEFVPLTNSFRSGGANAVPMTTRQAMQNGRIDMARQQFPLLVGDVMGGGKNLAVSVVASNPIYFLLARPEITSFAALKGKTVIATGATDGITIWTRKLLAIHGLKDGDFKLTSVAGNPARITCMKARECDAGTVPQPAVFDGRAAGLHPLGVLSETGVPLLQVDIVNPAWAPAHRDLVVKYIRANTSAMQFIADPRNREELLKLTVDFTKEPENVAREMLANATNAKAPVFPKQAGIDMGAVKAAIALLGAYKVLNQPLPAAERFVDASYSNAAGR
jgi:ABC-type nitrate/sulfonate/bicarbonate transport system substrate-binding protein